MGGAAAVGCSPDKGRDRGGQRPAISLLFGTVVQTAQHHQLVVLAALEDGLQPGPHITHLCQQTGLEEAALDVQRAVQPSDAARLYFRRSMMALFQGAQDM